MTISKNKLIQCIIASCTIDKWPGFAEAFFPCGFCFEEPELKLLFIEVIKGRETEVKNDWLKLIFLNGEAISLKPQKIAFQS